MQCAALETMATAVFAQVESLRLDVAFPAQRLLSPKARQHGKLLGATLETAEAADSEAERRLAYVGVVVLYSRCSFVLVFLDFGGSGWKLAVLLVVGAFIKVRL